MVTASEHPLPAVAAVVACAIVTTRYMPATGVATRLAEPSEAVCEVSATLPRMVGVKIQLPDPAMACRLSQVPTPEFAGSRHTVPSKYNVTERPATISPLVGSVNPSGCFMFLIPTLSTFNDAAPVLV